jgi:hypothetical protein
VSQAVQVAEAPAAEPVVQVAAAAPQDSDWGLPQSAPEPVQIAAATPAPVPEAVEAVAAPAPEAPAYAEAPSYYTPAPEEPATPSEAEVRTAVAVRAMNRSAPAVIRTAAVVLPPAPFFRRAVPRPAAAAPVSVGGGDSRVVVQIGAFLSEANAERAWVDAQRRFGLSGRAPLTATIGNEGRVLHRVAISGFAGRSEAQNLCSSIRAQGGVCFVRNHAGDASIRWAARYANSRERNV